MPVSAAPPAPPDEQQIKAANVNTLVAMKRRRDVFFMILGPPLAGEFPETKGCGAKKQEEIL
jgi:hypothetical protein